MVEWVLKLNRWDLKTKCKTASQTRKLQWAGVACANYTLVADVIKVLLEAWGNVDYVTESKQERRNFRKLDALAMYQRTKCVR